MISREVNVKWVDTQTSWNHSRILEVREDGGFAFQLTPCNPLCERCEAKLLYFPDKLKASGLPGKIETRDMDGWMSSFLCIDSVLEFGTAEECLRRVFNTEIVS